VLEGLKSVTGASNLDELALRALRHQFAQHLDIGLSPLPTRKPNESDERFLRRTASLLFDLQVDEPSRSDFLRARRDIATQLNTTWEELVADFD
jgi:hypothetical protein